LRAGQLVFSGGVTAPVPVVAGGSVTFEFGGLGFIEVAGSLTSRGRGKRSVGAALTDVVRVGIVMADLQRDNTSAWWRDMRWARLLPCRCRRPVAAGLSAFTRHTITSPDVLRQRLSVIRLTQMATSRNEFECGKAAIAMLIFYGGGRVGAAIELTVGNLGSDLRLASGALSVACRSLSRQLATELHMREAETVTRSPTPRRPRGAHSTDPPDSRSSPEVLLLHLS
jgi:hypothetical protein